MNFFTPIFVVRLVNNCSWQVQFFIEKWGRPVLTGCVKTYASMQAREVRALKDDLKIQVARQTTPWLLNLAIR